MACVNDGAATPEYCLPKFFKANKKIFDYLYLMWADASEDDQYMTLFAESLCYMAPNDDGIPQYCVPVLKMMEDDMEDDKAKAIADKLVLDPDSDGYNKPDNLKKVKSNIRASLLNPYSQ